RNGDRAFAILNFELEIAEILGLRMVLEIQQEEKSGTVRAAGGVAQSLRVSRGDVLVVRRQDRRHGCQLFPVAIQEQMQESKTEVVASHLTVLAQRSLEVVIDFGTPV